MAEETPIEKLQEQYGAPANKGYSEKPEEPTEAEKSTRHNLRDATGRLIKKPRRHVESSGSY